MLFNSYIFFVFFVFVFLISRLIRSWTLRKFFLLISSYLFYASWNPPFVALLWISTITDWFLAKRIYNSKDIVLRKVFLLLSLLVNLGLLAYFKYGEFFLDNFIFFLNLFGMSYQPVEFSIILPVGISFYTFQTLSYSIDIYRGKTKPWFSFLDYALYVTFFPQLVAGPIVRATEFLPQLSAPKLADLRQIAWGLCLLSIGLFNKVVIADSFLAPIVQSVYDSNRVLSFLEAWTGTLAFSFQILCDFSGYSLCAIGAALMLGFVLPDNFHFPYASVGFSDFWRRWHISLSSWLRDYLYISLGGNRQGYSRTLINLLITMLIGGLWHGASWLFVIWGGLHGLYLVIERMILSFSFSQSQIWKNHLVQRALSLITYALVCIAWVFFRADNLPSSINIVASMFGLNSFFMNVDLIITKKDYLIVALITFVYLSFQWRFRKLHLEDIFSSLSWKTQSAIVTVLIFLTTVSLSGVDRAFIYFQF